MPACAGNPYFLGGMFYDEADKKLYAPMHCESFKAGGRPNRKIHLATSVDKGATWRYEGPIMTVGEDDEWGLTPTGVEKYPEAMWHRSSGFTYNGGDADYYLCTDEKKEYVYLYTCNYGPNRSSHVIRCAVKDKLAPGKWRVFRDGHWNEPALGGQGSHINVYYSMYNTYLKKYIGFSMGSGLAVCTDLSKQDWSPTFRIGTTWNASREHWAFAVVNEEKNDPHIGDRVLYLYTYYIGFGQRYRITFGPGETRANEGYSLGFCTCPDPVASMDPEFSRLYKVGPWLDSTDPIERRRTKIAKGERSLAVSPNSTTKMTKFSLSFQGDSIYWRCGKGPGYGKADVFVDGVLRKTVDCGANRDILYSPTAGFAFGFVQTGLDPAMKHTIEVVGPKTQVSHLYFEYGVDIYRATDGISGYMGRHQWYYQQRDGTVFTNMTFGWVPEKPRVSAGYPYWFGEKCSIQKTGLVSEQNEAVLKWVAPHDGTVSIEGGRRCLILQNAKRLWPADGERQDDSAPLTTKVVSGDAICFVLEKAADGSRKECPLDQVVTYLVDGAKSQKDHRPSTQGGQP